MVLLVCNDYVDVVRATEAVIGDREQAVRIWRQVDADDLWALVANNIQETGILMSEAIVILSKFLG